MAISITASSQSQTLDVSRTRPGRPDDVGSVQGQARAELNLSIVQTSIEVSIDSGNEPLALLFRSAIAGINEALAPEFGDNAIENALNQDNSPEGTAGRIVALSTGLFALFREQYPGEEEPTVLEQFMATIREGVERGFREAREILDGLGVLEGDIATNIDRTFELVEAGFAAFEAKQREAFSPPAE